MIRQANLNSVSAIVREKMQKAGVELGNQETLNLTASFFGFKNWAHYQKVKEQHAREVGAVFNKLVYIARLNLSVDRSFVEKASRMVEELKAEPAPVVDNTEELKELRVALQWVCANYLSTLSGKPVRDADECLSYAKVLLARAEPDEDTQPSRSTSTLASVQEQSKPSQNEAQLRTQQEGTANAAFEAYDFGEGVVVVESNGWERDTFDGKDDWTKVVYVECDDDEAGADSHKVSFHAAFDEGKPTLQEAYAYWCETGAEIGHMGGTNEEAATAQQASSEKRAAPFAYASRDPRAPKTADQSLSSLARQLADFYGTATSWGEHPNYPRKDWQYAVENGDTGASYWEYVVSEIVSHDDVFPWQPEMDMADKVLDELGCWYEYHPLTDGDVDELVEECRLLSPHHKDYLIAKGPEQEGVALMGYYRLLNEAANGSAGVSVDALKKMTFQGLMDILKEHFDA